VTSKVSVMDDYSELLHQSIMDTKSVLEELADGELDLYPRIHDGVEMQTILNFEMNSRAREIKIFNSQLFTITDIFEIRVNVGDGGGADELLLSIGGKAIQAQIEPYFIKGKLEKDSRLVLFEATIPPLSMIKVRVQKKNSGGKTVLSKLEISKLSDTWKELEGSFWSLKTTKPSTLSLETQFLETSHDPVTGALQKATKLGSEQTFSCEQSWQKYRDAAGGAYLMRLSSETTDITSNLNGSKSRDHFARLSTNRRTLFSNVLRSKMYQARRRSN
uniref:Glyco_hydro_38C domain-containing protein n=1 Tax=Caenorhabditis japonica TaxID=281687 RepID=A0A8R1EGC7_CAEJA